MDRPAQASFADIKRGLDPRFSYLVIVNTAAQGRLSDFAGIRAALDPFSGDILELMCYQDDSARHLFLVVSMAPDQAVQIRDQILSCKRPDSLVVYFYGSSPNGEGSLTAHS
jgi:hypothetical protein